MAKNLVNISNITIKIATLIKILYNVNICPRLIYKIYHQFFEVVGIYDNVNVFFLNLILAVQVVQMNGLMCS